MEAGERFGIALGPGDHVGAPGLGVVGINAQ
jgi:hypothetical protein